MDVKDIIKKYPAVKDIISDIPEDIKISVKNFKAKTIVVKEYDKVDKVLILCSGSMIVFNEFESGDIMTISELEPSGFIGEIETLAGLDEYVCTVSAISDCTMISMLPADFIRWFNESDSLAREIAKRISIRNCTQAREIGSLKYYNANYQIGAYLMQLAGPYIAKGKNAEIKITRAELAHRRGISERTVNRVISKLKGLNMISVQYGMILISNEQYKRLVQWVNKSKLR